MERLSAKSFIKLRRLSHSSGPFAYTVNATIELPTMPLFHIQRTPDITLAAEFTIRSNFRPPASNRIHRLLPKDDVRNPARVRIPQVEHARHRIVQPYGVITFARPIPLERKRPAMKLLVEDFIGDAGLRVPLLREVRVQRLHPHA